MFVCCNTTLQMFHLHFAYQSLCNSSLLFVLSCFAVHGAPKILRHRKQIDSNSTTMLGDKCWNYRSATVVLWQHIAWVLLTQDWAVIVKVVSKSFIIWWFTWFHCGLSPVFRGVKELLEPPPADGCVQGATLTQRTGDTEQTWGNKWRLFSVGAKKYSQYKFKTLIGKGTFAYIRAKLFLAWTILKGKSRHGY